MDEPRSVFFCASRCNDNPRVQKKSAGLRAQARELEALAEVHRSGRGHNRPGASRRFAYAFHANYYSAPDEGIGYYCLKMAALLFAWEFFFRGFLLFGLKEKFQEKSIFIQMVPFALMHLAKPEAEALSTVVTGTLFGFIAYRSGSFWPAFIIHLMLNIGNRVIMEITR